MQHAVWTVTGAEFAPAAAVTRIGYPAGETRSRGVVVGVVRLIGTAGEPALGVVLDTTAAHPLSPTWPDQPADAGVLVTARGERALLDVRQGVLTPEGLLLDAPRAEGAAVVVHVVDGTASVALGETVTVAVDTVARRALSLAHSACHLNALALDAVLVPYWNKPVPQTDSLGHPAFDQLAIQSSRLSPHRAVDVYRLGKSLRKKGFDASRLAGELAAVTGAHAALLQHWVAADAPLHVEAGDGTLAARRAWCCVLDDTEVVIPCGGTHAASTGELAGIHATYRLAETLDELVVTTTLPG
ncbi:metal-dependent hydrolase [Nakamurella deserti]|uniref:metal-dependent hydrolase n=1 Tax=Nakamurella deserti TaxID=2164074 RepID=UPI000DBE9CFB|nr:metal-dependent hydrolase [Nakamurella deserti]